MRANREWENSNNPIELNIDFHKEILPSLQALTLSEIMATTGLSLRYCSLIRRGLTVPHPRHWSRLKRAVTLPADG